jgi:hypothetical protein
VAGRCRPASSGRPAVWWEVGQVGSTLVADPPPCSRLLGFWVPVVGPLGPLNKVEGFRTSSFHN